MLLTSNSLQNRQHEFTVCKCLSQGDMHFFPQKIRKNSLKIVSTSPLMLCQQYWILNCNTDTGNKESLMKLENQLDSSSICAIVIEFLLYD